MASQRLQKRVYIQRDAAFPETNIWLETQNMDTEKPEIVFCCQDRETDKKMLMTIGIPTALRLRTALEEIVLGVCPMHEKEWEIAE